MTVQKNNLLYAVVEIDEVEYFINQKTANSILNKEKIIRLTRIIDGEIRTISLEGLLKIIKNGGIVDHLSR